MKFRRGLIALMVLVVCARATKALAQTPGLPHIKASYVLNFATFTEWPGLADSAVAVCVVNADEVATALRSLAANGTLDGRGVQVKILPPDQSPRGCQIVYIGSHNPKLAAELLAETTTRPVLTVSDAESFAESGGMIELFEDKGRVRFAVNVDAVRRSKLRVSSRVLGIARIVRDTNVR